MQSASSVGNAFQSSSISFPVKVEVSELVLSRYGDKLENFSRPLIWENRISGIDVVKLNDGSEIRLLSDGQQTPPKKGWVLMLLGGDAHNGYEWTLYGMPTSK
jgi:hypothetical protein